MLFNIMLVLIFAIVLSILIELPLIYARLRDKKRWVPINSAPWMIGDDFYYYSFLNLYHKKLLKKFYKQYHHIYIRRVPISITFQLAGVILNMIPYHLGWMLEDKRLAVLFVKIWNRFLLFISIYFCAFSILDLLGSTMSTVEYFGLTLLFFAIYPGPLSLSKNGLLWNSFNNKHLFDYAQVNDLTRGMHSETTVPILFFAIATLLSAVGMQQIAIAIGIFSIILYFQYFPAFIVFGLLSITILVYYHFFVVAILIGSAFFLMALYYVYILGKCKVSSELIVHDDGRKLFRFGKRSSVEFLIISAVCLAIYFQYKNPTLTILVSISSLFFLTNFLFKHQLSRFWDRGATSIVQLIMASVCVKEVFEYNSNYLYIMVALLLSLIILYFSRNTLFLWDKSSTKTVNEAAVNSLVMNSKSELVYVTDNLELSSYIDLYTNDRPLILNFMLQTKGYKDHLVDICLNYKYLGYNLEAFLGFLTGPAGDWRSLKARENIDESYTYRHEVQYLSTCYLFNHKIIIDGMFVDSKWTNQYVSFLKDTWESVRIGDCPNFKIVRKI